MSLRLRQPVYGIDRWRSPSRPRWAPDIHYLKGTFWLTHCMVASSDKVYGPYGPRYVAVPHGGHNMFFTDREGNWWATFFGNDPKAPFRERPAMLRIELDDAGRVRPKGR